MRRRPAAGVVVVGVLTCLTLLGLTGCAGSGADDSPSTVAAESSATDGSASAGALSAQPSASPAPSALAVTVKVPNGMTAGIVVYDRQTKTFVTQQKGNWRFRSASLVKLLITLDYFWNRGPAYAVPAADKPKLDIMLRSSDDSAATGLWKANGQREIVNRMVQRLGLQDTAPPPANQPGYWGYTAVSAADLVRIYQYVLDKAPQPVREFVMGNLHQATKCGTDRFDQSFGIPGAFKKPWSAKQGWSGFGDKPATPCVANAALARGTGSGSDDEPPGATTTTESDKAERGGPHGGSGETGQGHPAVGTGGDTGDGGNGAFEDVALAPNPLDMSGEVLHTTGTVGDNDHYIVAVLSVHPNATQYAKAATTLTQLTKSLPLPAAIKAP